LALSARNPPHRALQRFLTIATRSQATGARSDRALLLFVQSGSAALVVQTTGDSGARVCRIAWKAKARRSTRSVKIISVAVLMRSSGSGLEVVISHSVGGFRATS
jgi:hypothetical protein